MSPCCRLSSTNTGALSCSEVGGLGSSPAFGAVLSLLKIASRAGVVLSMMDPETKYETRSYRPRRQEITEYIPTIGTA